MPSAASVGQDFPPAFEGATSEQHRPQLRSHVPTARLEHFPAALSWSQVYLLLLGVLLEHVGHVPLEQVERHLPEGTIEREEQDVGFWATRAEQFAEVEGEMSEQKAAWSAGKGGGGTVVGGGEGLDVGRGCVFGGGVVGLGVCGGGGGCFFVVVLGGERVREKGSVSFSFLFFLRFFFSLSFSL